MSTTYREYIDQLNQEHTPGFYEQFKDIFKRALGVFLYDISGNPYLDCMSAFSAVNQGHCHDRIVAALVQQAGLMACTGQKIKNDVTPKFLKFLCELIGFDQCFMANSGVEAVEGGNKLARKYAFEIMGLPMGQGKIIVAEHNFHGRTSLALAMSTDQSSKRGFGPFPEGFIPVPFNDIETMKDAVERNPDVIAICIEPIQGEAGIIIPDGNYLQQVRDLCTKKEILFIADEIQSGLSRCGELTACSLFNVKPDILLLGKALSGGMLPISAVLANKKVMVAINERGVHGSTFAASPLASAVAREAVQVILDEKLCENSTRMGKLLREGMRSIESPLILDIRGKGLMTGITVDPKISQKDLQRELYEQKLITCPAHEHFRIAPPTCANQENIHQIVDGFKNALAQI